MNRHKFIGLMGSGIAAGNASSTFSLALDQSGVRVAIGRKPGVSHCDYPCQQSFGIELLDLTLEKVIFDGVADTNLK